MIRNKMVWLLGVACTGGIGASPGCSERPIGAGGTDLPLSELYKNRYSRISVSRNEVIVAPDRWQAVWGDLGGTVVPAPPVPVVDFTNAAVIVVAMGENPDACWTVAIKSVRETSGLLQVTAANIRSPASCSCPAVVVQPVHVVSVQTDIDDAAFDVKTTTEGPECN